MFSRCCRSLRMVGTTRRLYSRHPKATLFAGKPSPKTEVTGMDSLGSIRGGMKKPFPSSPASSATMENVVNPNLKPEVQMFAGSGRRPTRQLPKIPKVWPKVVVGLLIALPLWGGFLFTVWNQEKLSSSIYLQILRTLRSSPSVQEMIGDAIRIEPVWWMNGEGIVWGEISHPTGSIDLSFRVKGTSGAGTLYFTSVRKEKGGPWTLLRFRLIGDTGTIVNIDPRLGWETK